MRFFNLLNLTFKKEAKKPEALQPRVFIKYIKINKLPILLEFRFFSSFSFPTVLY